MNTMWYAHTTEYYSAPKGRKPQHTATQMNLEDVVPITKPQRLHDSTQMWSGWLRVLGGWLSVAREDGCSCMLRVLD